MISVVLFAHRIAEEISRSILGNRKNPRLAAIAIVIYPASGTLLERKCKRIRMYSQTKTGLCFRNNG